MPSDTLMLAGSIAGILGVSYATFTVVSYNEMRSKIDAQVSRGQEPYQLKVEQQPRAKPLQKTRQQAQKKPKRKKK